MVGQNDQKIIGSWNMIECAQDFTNASINVTQIFQCRPGIRSKVMGDLIVAAVGGVNAWCPGIDFGDHPKSLHLAQDDIAEDADEREKPLLGAPGFFSFMMPLIFAIGPELIKAGQKHAAGSQGVDQQEKNDAKAAKAAEECLWVG